MSTARRPASGRQEVRSAATREQLVGVARPLFATRGFDAVPAEEIVERAGLTRGALYHHFGGKEGLFDAVHEAVHRDIGERIERAAARATGAWDALVAGCLAFLDSCTDPEVQRIVLLDAPVVLGWERWRAVDAAHGLGMLKEGLREAMAAGALAEQPVDPLAHLLSGAMNEAGMWIARAAHPKRARREADGALRAMLEAMRATQRSRRGGSLSHRHTSPGREGALLPANGHATRAGIAARSWSRPRVIRHPAASPLGHGAPAPEGTEDPCVRSRG